MKLLSQCAHNPFSIMNLIPPPIKELIREYVFSTQPKVEFKNVHRQCMYLMHVGHASDCSSCKFYHDIHLSEGSLSMVIHVQDLSVWKKDAYINTFEANTDEIYSTYFTGGTYVIRSSKIQKHYIRSRETQIYISKRLYDLTISEYRRFLTSLPCIGSERSPM